jgi:hypothetical protein
MANNLSLIKNLLEVSIILYHFIFHHTYRSDEIIFVGDEDNIVEHILDLQIFDTINQFFH